MDDYILSPQDKEMIANLFGQSRAVDSMIVDGATNINSGGNAIKEELLRRERIEQQLRHQQMVQHMGGQPQQMLHQVVSEHPIPQPQMYINPQPQQNDNQLEFDFKPSSLDETNKILREISGKLSKLISVFDPEKVTKLKVDKNS